MKLIAVIFSILFLLQLIKCQQPVYLCLYTSNSCSSPLACVYAATNACILNPQTQTSAKVTLSGTSGTYTTYSDPACVTQSGNGNYNLATCFAFGQAFAQVFNAQTSQIWITAQTTASCNSGAQVYQIGGSLLTQQILYCVASACAQVGNFAYSITCQTSAPSIPSGFSQSSVYSDSKCTQIVSVGGAKFSQGCIATTATTSLTGSCSSTSATEILFGTSPNCTGVSTTLTFNYTSGVCSPYISNQYVIATCDASVFSFSLAIIFLFSLLLLFSF